MNTGKLPSFLRKALATSGVGVLEAKAIGTLCSLHIIVTCHSAVTQLSDGKVQSRLPTLEPP